MGGWGAGLIALVLATSVAACDSDDNAAPTTTPPNSASSSTSTRAEPNCAAHLPDGFTTLVSEERVTVADIRSLVVATLPPGPTQLVLPSHSADDAALFCIASDGGKSYNSYWVAGGGEVGDVCVVTYADGPPANPTWNGCD